MKTTKTIGHHVISEDEIIGIGPLMAERPSDMTAQAFRTTKYYYVVLLRHYSIQIESEWMRLAEAEDYKEKAQEFKKQYETDKAAIEETFRHSI